MYLGSTVYRIHGTNQPSTIGKFVSSGCIGMLNEDVSDLFDRVKVGTRVVVMPGGPAAPGANVKASSGIVRVAAAWAADGPTQQGNIFGPARGSLFGKNRGDVEQAVQTADAVVEQEFYTPVQTHSCLETHAAIAYWEPGNRLVVHCGAKSVTSTREELADHFGLPHSHVRVTNEFIGGHFGSKASSLPYTAIAAQLAKQAGRPVKVALSRKDDPRAAARDLRGVVERALAQRG